MDIDPDVTKLKDPRVQQLLRGQGSVELISRTLNYPDWLVVDKDKLTAVPQYQYATMVPTKMLVLSQQLLNEYLSDTQLISQLPAQVQARLRKIKEALDICPVCKRQSYKKQVKQLLSPYIKQQDTQTVVQVQYPDTSVQFKPVFNEMTAPIRQSIPRHACYDCIQKHIGQASVTAMQAQLGYPQHIMLCYGHLAEAIQECPEDAVQLKALLTLCLGVSKLTGHGFVPLRALYASVQQHRHADQGSGAVIPNQQDVRYTLQHNITTQLIQRLSESDRCRLYYSIKSFVHICKRLKQLDSSDSHEYSAARGNWLGLLACVAELLSAYSIQSANAIRNIRLLFYAAPQLICDVPQYNLCDVMELLLPYMSRQQVQSTPHASSAQDVVCVPETEI